MIPLLLVGYLIILPLTWATLRLLDVPDHLELTAGALLTFAYTFLGAALAVSVV